MPKWLLRYHTAVALLDAPRLPSSLRSRAPRTAEAAAEMPDHVFQAIIDGKIGEVDMEDMEEYVASTAPEMSFGDTVSGLAQMPLRALALAMLCRALPEAGDLARITARGAITVLACHPAGLAGELALVLRALIPAERPGVTPNLVCTASSVPSPDAKPSEAVAGFWGAVLAGGTTPQLLVLGDEAQLPRRMARQLPPVIRIGAPDAACVAAALSLSDKGPGPMVPESALPPDSVLRQFNTDAWKLAFRAPDLATRLAELGRLALRMQGGARTPTLDDLSLDEPVAGAARRLVADIAGWRDGRNAWTEMTRSILLWGEPGTGKTVLARAIAASADLPLITGSLAEWQAAGHLGDMLREMRACTARARAAAPCILFIDELDAIGSRASTDRHASSYRAQVIAGLLQEWDGVLGLEGVLVIAATNHPGAIDPAILRPGRIDRMIELPRPGPAVLRSMLARMTGDALEAADLDDLARRATGRSPAELDAAWREAQSLARAEARGVITADLAHALGLTREDRALMRRMAIHEAGHALMLHHLRRGRITGVRIGANGGHVAVEDLPAIDTRAGLEDHLACRLAGRAAEVLILGTATTGAGGVPTSDLALATQLATGIEVSYGLGTGLTWEANPAARLVGDPGLRDRVEAHLQRAHNAATEVLANRTPELLMLAARLEVERVIDDDPFAVADAPTPAWASARSVGGACPSLSAQTCGGDPASAGTGPSPIGHAGLLGSADRAEADRSGRSPAPADRVSHHGHDHDRDRMRAPDVTSGNFADARDCDTVIVGGSGNA